MATKIPDMTLTHTTQIPMQIVYEMLTHYGYSTEFWTALKRLVRAQGFPFSHTERQMFTAGVERGSLVYRLYRQA